MKFLLKKRRGGFSLVELMVVVAIIALLAAIAVPQYQKFQAKAKQSEAKTNLGGLYTAEQAFFTEWNQYFADFRDIGYEVRGNLYYNVGFG
ncbi:MAG: prepilin-type N-terminal cleavage/methylation domain-containing protein, partial [Bdellovibrio sp.]